MGISITDTSAFEFDLKLRHLRRIDDCTALFRAAIAPFGFDTFACGELDLRDRDRAVFYAIDWTERWQRFYAKSGLINRDPVVEALADRREPFTWTDLRTDRKLHKVGREALDLAAQEGWTEGLVVPFPSSGHRVGLVSMAGHRLIREIGDRAFLCTISACFHNHVRTLVPIEGFATPPIGLTEREVECIRLVARGQSDRMIATSLGIAHSTAHEYIENAKRKTKVRSRAELVALAVALAIVDI